MTLIRNNSHPARGLLARRVSAQRVSAQRGSPQPTRSGRALVIAVIIMCMLSLAGAAGMAWLTTQRNAAQVPPDTSIRTGPGPQLVLDLMDTKGLPVTTADVRGHHCLVYFGYTSCPDICPTELSFISKVLKALGSDADQLQVFFVTVDPERDTAARLAEYVPYFDHRIRGLVGSREAIDATMKAAGVMASKVTPVGVPDRFYLMNHSLSTFHFGPDGELLETYQSADGVASVVADIRAQLRKSP